MYEGGIRIPFIVKWPAKIKAGTTSNFVGAFWDVVPTLTTIAGIEKSPGDGISFLPELLQQSQKQKHEFLYWEFYEGGFKQAVRQEDWKAIRFYKGATPNRTELYYLKNDRGETTNLALTHPGKVSEMEALMDKAHTPSQSALFQIK